MSRSTLTIPCAKAFDAEALVYLKGLGVIFPDLGAQAANPAPAPVPAKALPSPLAPAKAAAHRWGRAFQWHRVWRGLRLLAKWTAWAVGIAMLAAAAAGLVWITLVVLWAILVGIVWPIIKFGLVLLLVFGVIRCAL